MKSQMSASEVQVAGQRFARLRIGMRPAEILKIVGKPDAIDRETDRANEGPDHWHLALLGNCADQRNENLAYIYFIERWADEIARRDPLRDRYVIVFFSNEGRLTRIFSNVAAIPPIFPATPRTWQRLICPTCPKGAFGEMTASVLVTK